MYLSVYMYSTPCWLLISAASQPVFRNDPWAISYLGNQEKNAYIKHIYLLVGQYTSPMIAKIQLLDYHPPTCIYVLSCQFHMFLLRPPSGPMLDAI